MSRGRALGELRKALAGKLRHPVTRLWESLRRFLGGLWRSSGETERALGTRCVVSGRGLGELKGIPDAQRPMEQRTRLVCESKAPQRQGVQLACGNTAPQRQGARVVCENAAPQRQGVQLCVMSDTRGPLGLVAQSRKVWSNYLSMCTGRARAGAAQPLRSDKGCARDACDCVAALAASDAANARLDRAHA